MPVDHFGDAVAARYDHDEAERFAPAVLDATVGVLTELAGGGAALELGVGTGRVALPLHRRGVPVHGVDLSEAMLGELAAKPGGAEIPVTIGDMAEVRLEQRFRLVYLVFNTIGNLTTQDEQVACFRTAAAHLEPGGCFVVEVGVPALRLLPPGETVRAFTISPDHLGVDEYDTATQGLVSHHHRLVEGRWVHRSVPFRYVWPAELDLMARLAGLVLRDRWAGWDRSPFTADSTAHVSIWERPA